MGPFEAVVNIGSVQPPQRKGRIPQYARDKLVDLQQKFDELEMDGVFARPENVGITVEYLNPSFLVKKESGGYRLVTAFGDVGRYSKPQPSLMPDVDSTLRLIARWKFIIATDLSSAFFQIPLKKGFIKILWSGHTFSWRSRLHQMCYGYAGVRNCLGRVDVSSFGGPTAGGRCGKNG